MASITKRQRKSGVVFTAQVRVMRDGVQVYSEAKTFKTRALANEWGNRRDQQLRDDPSELSRLKHRGLTIGDLIDRYMEDRAQTDALGRSKAAHIRMLRGMPIATRDALMMTPQHLVAHIRERRLAGTGAATVANDLIWLRVVFRYARGALGIPVNVHVFDDAAHVCRSERLIARPRKRRRRPTSDELIRIGEWFKMPTRRGASGMVMYLAMWFAIYSCRRFGEICALRLSDLDRDHNIWLVRDVKNPGGSSGNDLEMIVPDRLYPVIYAAIASIDRDDDRLFPFNERTLGSNWTRAMKILGIEDLHFHDLRHEGCSRLAEDGKSIPEIQQISLHESWSSLQVYVNMRKRVTERVEFDPCYTPV